MNKHRKDECFNCYDGDCNNHQTHMHDEKKIEEILNTWQVPSGIYTNEMFYEYAEHCVQREREKIVENIKLYFKNDATLEQQLSGASGKTIRDIINIIQINKEDG